MILNSRLLCLYGMAAYPASHAMHIDTAHPGCVTGSELSDCSPRSVVEMGTFVDLNPSWHAAILHLCT